MRSRFDILHHGDCECKWREVFLKVFIVCAEDGPPQLAISSWEGQRRMPSPVQLVWGGEGIHRDEHEHQFQDLLGTRLCTSRRAAAAPPLRDRPRRQSLPAVGNGEHAERCSAGERSVLSCFSPSAFSGRACCSAVHTAFVQPPISLVPAGASISPVSQGGGSALAPSAGSPLDSADISQCVVAAGD